MSVHEPAIEVETVIVRLRRHGRRLVPPVLLLILLAAASGFWVGALPEAWMNWAAGLGAIAIALLLGVGPILAWLNNRVIVTDRRVIVRQGFLVQRRAEVPISRVREVRSRRGIVQRMFGSGDVELLVGADEPTILRDVPAPALLVDALQELIERNYDRIGGPSAGFGPGMGSGTGPGQAGSHAAPAHPGLRDTRGPSDFTTVLPG